MKYFNVYLPVSSHDKAGNHFESCHEWTPHDVQLLPYYLHYTVHTGLGRTQFLDLLATHCLTRVNIHYFQGPSEIEKKKKKEWRKKKIHLHFQEESNTGFK